MGYYSDYPVAGKVAGKPICKTREHGLFGPSRGRKACRTVPNSSGRSPYSWPPESQKEPNPEKACFLRSFLASFEQLLWLPPSPRAAFDQNREKGVSERVTFLDPFVLFLRLAGETSKSDPDPSIGDEKWPILWHIWCFPELDISVFWCSKAIRKLQRIFRRRA